MIKTFKYKLYNSKNNKYLHRQINISCWIYNHCVSLHKRYYKIYHKSLNTYRLQKHLTKLKKLPKYSKWRTIGSQAIQDITDRINKGYKSFYRKQAKTTPKYKGRYRYKSFTLKQAGYKLSVDNQITINKRKYKFFKSRNVEGQIKLLTIKRDNLGNIFLYFICEVNKLESISKTGKTAGIDFGLKTFLTLSNETTYDNPEYLKNSISKLKTLQQSLSLKKKGSNNRKKAKLRVSKIHQKISNQRTDYLFKLSRELCLKYDELYIEDLDLNSMKEKNNFGRKISDLSYGEFIKILEYYCSKTGKKLSKIDRYFPSSKTCSHCGWYNNDLKLSDRVFKCKICNKELDRDLNASKNILRVGTSTLCDDNLQDLHLEDCDSIESPML
jgi:putative transposase